MKNCLILHGTDFSKTQTQRFSNWFSWLQKELEKRNYQVWVPELPKAWEPNLKRYWRFIKVKDFKFGSKTILVGHSSGAAVIPGILQKLPEKTIINKVILIAPFYKDEGWHCEGLFTEKLNWQKIKKSAQEITLIHSLDDPYVKPEQAYYIQKKLDCRLIMKKHEGHFNLEKGPQYKQLPLILDLI